MDMLQLDVARELHRDRERMAAERRAVPPRANALRAPARRLGLALAALDHVAVLTGRRLRFAH
jgi:hypothetical protein